MSLVAGRLGWARVDVATSWGRWAWKIFSWGSRKTNIAVKCGGFSSCWSVLVDSSFSICLLTGSFSLLFGFETFEAVSNLRVMLRRPVTMKEDISGGGDCAAA